MSIPNGNYKGKFNDKGLYDFKKLVDYSLTSVEERLALVEAILGVVEEDGIQFTDEEFFREVWDSGVCKAELNTTDITWTETNVAKFLEQLGTYLIMAYENEEGIKRNEKCYDSTRDNAKDGREEKLRGRLSEAYEEEGFKGNYKLAKKDDWNKECNIDKYCEKYPKLKDYNEYRLYLKSLKTDDLLIKELQNKVNPFKVNKFKLDEIIGGVKEDMKLYKLSIERPILFKAPLKDEGCPEWDELDMFNPNHVLPLLKVKKGNDLQDDISCIVMDLNKLIKKIKFTEIQNEILNLYRREKTLVEIADILDVSPKRVKGGLTQITNLIIKEYEKEYMDWYYLNKVKGTYKQCKECGEIKLIQNFYKKDKNRYESKCKECRNK